MWLRRTAWTLLAVLVVCVLVLAFLPRIVSSGWFRGPLRLLASRVVQREVRLANLSLAWSGELLVEGLEIADAPEFSPAPLVSLKRLRVRVDPLGLIRRRLALDVALDGLTVQVIRNPDGRTNVEAFLAGLPPSKPKTAPTALPFDQATVRARLAGIRVLAQDRARGRTAAIEDASLSLDVPALAEPATAKFLAGLTLDGRALPPLRLEGRVEKLVRPDGTLNLDAAVVAAEGAFPGGVLTLRVDLGKSVARGGVEVDVSRLMEVVRPFAPSRVAATELGGRLTVVLDSAPNPDGSLALELMMTGAGLEASGGFLEGRALGPVKFEIRTLGTLDARRVSLSVETGEIRLQERSRASWTASVTGLRGPAPEVSATVRSVTLDLQELVALAVAFLPRGLDVRVGDPKRASSLLLERVEVSGPVKGGPNPVRMEGLRLSLPRFGLISRSAAVSGSDLALSVEHLSGTLVGFFPERILLQAAFRCGRLQVTGPNELHAEGIDASASRLELVDLARAGGFLGITGRGGGTHSFAARGIEVPGVAHVREYRHSAEGELSIQRGDVVSLLVRRISVSANSAGAEASRAGASIRLEASRSEPAVAAEISGLRVSGGFRAGPNSVELDRATLAFPRVRAKIGASLVTAERMQLALRPLAAALRQQFPGRIDLRATARIGALQVSGARPASIKDLALPSLDLAISELRRADDALFGVAAKIRVSQSLSAGEIDVPALARITGVSESAKIGGEIGPGRTARFAADGFGLDVASVRAEIPGLGLLQTAARVRGRLDRVGLRGLEAAQIDIAGLRASVAAGDFLEMDLQASARGLGWESLTARGAARLDLAELGRVIPAETLRGSEVSGTAKVEWALDGRLPARTEAEASPGEPRSLVQAIGLGFLRQAAVSASLTDVGAKLTLAGGNRVSVSGLTTEAPLTAGVQNGLIGLNARLVAEKIEAVPWLGSLGEPVKAAIRVRGDQTGPGSMRLSESLSVERLGLTQEMQANLSGLDRLMARGLGSPLPLWLMLLGGDARASIGLAAASGPGLRAENVTLRGAMTAGVELRLARGEELAVGAWVTAAGAEAALGNQLEVKDLNGDIVVEKRYRLARVSPGPTSLPSASVRLSEEVLNGRARVAIPAPRDATRFGGGSAVRLGFVRTASAPLPVEARHVSIEMSLVSGLLAVERFRADLLGGSVVGSLAISQPVPRTGPGLSLKTSAAFTGLDAAQLAPDGARGAEDTELSGRVSLSVPLGAKLDALLAGMELETDLSHIGTRTLDRALFALDPSESNEAIVKQRKLLRLGSPRRVKMGVRNGNLSVSGQVQAVGIQLDLPRVERVSVAGLPGLRRFEATLAGLVPVFDLLKLSGADVLEIDDAGHVTFSTKGGAR